jgi:hypothetical protein
MMTLSMDVSAMPRSGKTLHCYHLVTLKSASPLQHFAAARRSRGVYLKSLWLWMIGFNVLALFCATAMFST